MTKAFPARFAAGRDPRSHQARGPTRRSLAFLPARGKTRAAANGTAAAARAHIFRSPGDMPCPAICSRASRGAKPCPQAVQ
jgi:hypothetical protein